MNYQKTFITETTTSKGVFPIELKVWKESIEPYASVSRWTFEGYVLVNGEKYPISAYWKTMGESHKMMKHFGVKYDTKFKADFSEVISYTQGIDREEAQKSAEYENDFNNMISSIGL